MFFHLEDICKWYIWINFLIDISVNLTNHKNILDDTDKKKSVRSL